MPDRRSLKTKKAIREAFFSLLKSKNLNQISVTKIANVANIGRGTFYLHYLDVADLYDKVTKELFDELALSFDKAYPTNNSDNLKKLITDVITFISANKSLFLIFIRLDGSEKTISKLKEIFNKKVVQESIKIFENENIDAEYLNTSTIFIVSGIVGVIEQWLEAGLVMQNEEIIDILHRIMVRFND